MWAPADLFSPVLNIFLLPLKRMVSFFYEHLVVTAMVVLAIAVTITVVTLITDRNARGT